MEELVKKRFVEFQGHRVLPMEFVAALNCMEIDSCRDKNLLNRVRLFQEALMAYQSGEECLSDNMSDRFLKYGMSLPAERNYPKAITEMYANIRTQIPSFLLDRALESAVRRTSYTLQQDDITRKNIREYLELTEQLSVEICPEGIDVLDNMDKIKFLAELQCRKEMSGKNHISEYIKSSRDASVWWCSLLVEQEFRTENLRFYMVQAALEGEYCTEREMEDLLKKSGWEHDWEWYSEDFIADITAPTILSPTEVLNICIYRLKKIVGLNNGYLNEE